MKDSHEHDEYFNDVIQRGDEASGSFSTACQEGNISSKAHTIDMLNPDGSIEINTQLEHTSIKTIKAVKESIDGVGTKVQIYTNQFEHIFQSRENKEIDGETAKKEATELWIRMLMELIAMNADDLRGGELAIGITNIIDINHLKGARGHLFQDSMADAMKIVIQETGIAITAGETAVLGMSPEAKKILTQVNNTMKDIEDVLQRDKGEEGTETLNSNTNNTIKELIQTFYDTIKITTQEISFNIGGTCLGLATDKNKLIPLEDEQIIIGFQEIPADGIIGPRSNGITKIRDDMETIMGIGRENQSFEDFIKKIGPEKSEKIDETVKNVCKNKKLRDIATGKTTVFNPFVSDKLLGGIESDANVGISALIHVTGNPLKKISEGINKDEENNYTIDIDMSNMTTPHIITLLQVALDISDEQAMNKRNMGVPYAVVCDKKDEVNIIKDAEINNITARKIGKIKKSTTTKEGENTISGVGLNQSNITF